MSGATMQGVTLYSKARKHQNDIFELALTYDGIEIRRPGESARHLSWDRVSEWEIEQRRGGVLLTLRGGGAVTPLIIPRWSVDELDVVLREVTSHAPSEPAEDLFHMPPSSEPTGTPRKPTQPSSAGATAPTPPPDPAPSSPPQPKSVAPMPPPSPPPIDEAPPTGRATSTQRQDIAPDSAAGALVWPNESPLDEIPNLSWPTSMTTRPAPDVSTEFVLPDEPAVEPPAPAPGALQLEKEPEPIRPPASEPEARPRDVMVSDQPVVDVLALVDDVLARPDVEVTPNEHVDGTVKVEPATEAPTVPAATKVVPTPAPRRETPPEAPTMAAPAVTAPLSEAPVEIAPQRNGPDPMTAIRPAVPPTPAPPRRRDRREQRKTEPRREARPPQRPAPAAPPARAADDTARATASNTSVATATKTATKPKPAPKTSSPKARAAVAPRIKKARRLTWRVVTTVILLTALALFVALVLAQSAGLLHLPFFGSPT